MGHDVSAALTLALWSRAAFPTSPTTTSRGRSSPAPICPFAAPRPEWNELAPLPLRGDRRIDDGVWSDLAIARGIGIATSAVAGGAFFCALRATGVSRMAASGRCLRRRVARSVECLVRSRAGPRGVYWAVAGCGLPSRAVSTIRLGAACMLAVCTLSARGAAGRSRLRFIPHSSLTASVASVPHCIGRPHRWTM